MNNVRANRDFFVPLPILKKLLNKSDPSLPLVQKLFMNAPYHVFVFGKLLVSRYLLLLLNGLKKVTTLVILCCPV